MRAQDKLSLLGLGLITGIVLTFSVSNGVFFGIENFLEDSLVSEKPISGKIVIAAIDNESLAKIGQWPWPREIFARALTNLEKYAPSAVGLDVIFADASLVGVADDWKLSDALNRISYPLIMPVEASPLVIKADNSATAGLLIKPLAQFTTGNSVSLGHVNLLLDADGVVRKFPSYIDEFQAFPLAVADRSGLVAGEKLTGISRIVYSAAPGAIKRVPFWRIWEGADLDLAGKIVLIGATSADLHDEKLTPMSRGSEMPGVEIQANIVNMMLENYRITPLPRGLLLLWVFLAALIPMLFYVVVKDSFQALLINLAAVFLNLLFIIFAFEFGIAANLVHILLAGILSAGIGFGYRYAVTEKEKRQMRSLFSKYVSGDVLNEILKNPEKVALGGEEKEVTVFFSDIRGFTTLSEKTTPKNLVRILNKYFTVMTNEVLKSGGVLDKYIGDAIMAFWGAPIANPDQADAALKASLAMLERLKELNAELKANGDLEINIGIGLYTGPAIVGNVGSELRFDYTVMGDTVNVASRLEGLNKEYKTQIIIGESTKNKIRGNYKFKSLGAAAVKGRGEKLNIYTIEK